MKSNDSGSAILIVIVLLGIGLAMLSQLISPDDARGREQADQLIRKSAIAAVEANVATYLANATAVQKTIQLQSGVGQAFECAAGAGFCSPTPRPLDLYDTGGAKYVDRADPSKGFTREGISCTGFSDATNRDCFARVELVWIPTCSGGCNITQNSLIRVEGRIVGKKISGATDLNYDRFNFFRELK